MIDNLDEFLENIKLDLLDYENKHKEISITSLASQIEEAREHLKKSNKLPKLATIKRMLPVDWSIASKNYRDGVNDGYKIINRLTC